MIATTIISSMRVKPDDVLLLWDFMMEPLIDPGVDSTLRTNALAGCAGVCDL
jgi:hypothetical protein